MFNPQNEYSGYNRKSVYAVSNNNEFEESRRMRAISKNGNNYLTLFSMNQEFSEYFTFYILKKLAEHK